MKIVDLMRQADREVQEIQRRLGVVREEDGTMAIQADNAAVLALIAIALVAISSKIMKFNVNLPIRKIEAVVGEYCVDIGFDDTEGVDEFYAGEVQQ